MRNIWSVLLLFLPCFVHSLEFPEPGEGPLIAVLEFEKRLKTFDPSEGSNASVSNIRFLPGTRRGGAASAIEFNYKQKLIYWTDLFERKVFSINGDGERLVQTTVLQGGMKSPEGLAYDWIHDNLYVSDWQLHKILVVNPQTGAKKTLLTNVSEVRDIEVDPENGWLYYIAGWESETARLGKFSLDGQIHEVVSRRLKYPSSLALDQDAQKLYWVETLPANKIKRIDVNGENYTTIYKGSSHYLYSPNDLTVSGDYVYWTQDYNWSSTLYRRIKERGNYPRTRYTKVGRGDDALTSLVAIEARKQRDGPNRCGDNNGGCSHFCLPSLPSSLPQYTCVCPDDMILMADNTTCTNIE
ncbi:low-density lipoprotein receptor 2 [Patella vulgata]|uniref:low-density lipoprotein receptor 2 n=1 Tax=Patella vulgata TaxID=6465 RepID=UPI00217F8815|nr:low-density lipoprotein receptor 2 [Patella vulgata]